MTSPSFCSLIAFSTASLPWMSNRYCIMRSSHRPDGTDFDAAMAGGRAARRPGECRVEIRHVDQEIAAELFLSLGIGAVERRGLAVRDAHQRCVARGPEPVRADADAFLAQRFAISGISGHRLL